MKKRSSTTTRSAPFDDTQVEREIEYIVDRARQHDARVVNLGPLVLFSSDTGDAWMLDAEDQLALPLVRDGVRSPSRIADLRRRFSVEWTSSFRFDGDLFVVEDLDTSDTRVIAGYPVRDIAAACRRPR